MFFNFVYHALGQVRSGRGGERYIFLLLSDSSKNRGHSILMCCDLAIRQTLPIASAIAIALRTFCAFEQLKYLSSTRRQLTLPTGEFRVSKCNANVQLAAESGALLLSRLHLKWAEQTDVAHGARRRKGRRSRSCRKTFHSTERERRARERRERRREVESGQPGQGMLVGAFVICAQLGATFVKLKSKELQSLPGVVLLQVFAQSCCIKSH